jgi:hypothetical protein
MSSTPPSSSSTPSSSTSSSSTAAAATLSSQDIKKKLQDYVDNRRKYKDYMHDLRTGWQKDFKRRAELDAAKKEAEKKEIVIQKAIRLREKRADAVIRQEKAKKLREQVFSFHYHYYYHYYYYYYCCCCCCCCCCCFCYYYYYCY